MVTIQPPRSLIVNRAKLAKNRPPRPIVSEVLPVETDLLGDDFHGTVEEPAALDIETQAKVAALEVAQAQADEAARAAAEAASALRGRAEAAAQVAAAQARANDTIQAAAHAKARARAAAPAPAQGEEKARIAAARAAQAMIDAAQPPAETLAEMLPASPASPATPGSPTEHRSRRALKRLKVVQLRNLCKKHGFSHQGTKVVLVERLATAD